MRRQNAARIPALLYHGDALILIRCFLSLFLLLSRDFPSMVCVSGNSLPYTAQPQKQPYRTIWANPVWWSVHDLLFFVSRSLQLVE